jgi:hypothetical protein
VRECASSDEVRQLEVRREAATLALAAVAGGVLCLVMTGEWGRRNYADLDWVWLVLLSAFAVLVVVELRQQLSLPSAPVAPFVPHIDRRALVGWRAGAVAALGGVFGMLAALNEAFGWFGAVFLLELCAVAYWRFDWLRAYEQRTGERVIRRAEPPVLDLAGLKWTRWVEARPHRR